MKQSSDAEHRRERTDVVTVPMTQEEVVRRREVTDGHAYIEDDTKFRDLKRRVDPSERDPADGVGACAQAVEEWKGAFAHEKNRTPLLQFSFARAISAL